MCYFYFFILIVLPVFVKNTSKRQIRGYYCLQHSRIVIGDIVRGIDLGQTTVPTVTIRQFDISESRSVCGNNNIVIVAIANPMSHKTTFDNLFQSVEARQRKI